MESQQTTKLTAQNASALSNARGRVASGAIVERAVGERAIGPEQMRAEARRAVQAWGTIRSSGTLRPLQRALARASAAIWAITDFYRAQPCGRDIQVSPSSDTIRAKSHLLRASIPALQDILKGGPLRRLPQTRAEDSPYLPRAFRAAQTFLDASNGGFDVDAFCAFTSEFAAGQAVTMEELSALRPFLELGLILRIGDQAALAARGPAGANSAAQTQRLFRSLAEVQTLNWNRILETLRPVDRILSEEPGGIYRRMDEASRNLYRAAIEQLSRRSGTSEEEIGSRAVELARWARQNFADDPRLAERRGNAGFFLIDAGRPVLAAEIGYQPSLAERFRQTILRHAELFYVLGIELVTLAVMAFLMSGLPRLSPILATILLLFLPATGAAVGIMNQLSSWLIEPRKLPRLDLSEGIPPELTTLVAVPALLISEPQTRQLVEDLEVRYLANRDANLHFALVTDAPDSLEPSSEDEKLADLCGNLIRELNGKYANQGHGTFFHFYRPRVFVQSEGKWMGFERKRGKILDLNNLLLGREDRFAAKQGDLNLLGKIRYVITLDADTQLPKDAAHRLIGTIAHPLNRAVIDPATNTVVEGYGILQPRVGVSIHSAYRSRLGNIYSGETGFDIYTCASSDVYQDLFGEGSFTGKGIYELETFQKVLWQRFPHNVLLSHDLLEGSYARTALASDVEVIDDYPSHFSAYSRRKHRWARGDWQVALWLLPRVPSFAGPWVPNPLKFIYRWKILDNLRRSLFEITCFLLLICGWLFLPGGPLHWTAAIVVLLVLPSYVELLLSLLRAGSLPNLGNWWKGAEKHFIDSQLWAFLAITFLAHQALVMADALVRTLVRQFWTRRRLLDWETAAEAEEHNRRRAAVDRYLGAMPCLCGGLSVLLAFLRPEALYVASPILLLWAGARWLVKWLDRAPSKQSAPLRPVQEQWLRGQALRTWRYFREKCTESVNWLVPDNVQENPPMAVEHLSPTNLGLLLNARLAAFELGYLTLPELVELSERTLDVAERLPRHRGHLFNWYDCRTLDPLPPRFISSVDSGNLAACLWTLGQACAEFSEQAIFQPSLGKGLRDHVGLLAETARSAVGHTVDRQMRQLLAGMEKMATTSDVIGLELLDEQTQRLEEALPAGKPLPPDLGLARDEVRSRIRAVRLLLETHLPWAMWEHRATSQRLGVASSWQTITLAEATNMAEEILRRLDHEAGTIAQTGDERLRQRLVAAAAESRRLADRLSKLAQRCDSWVREMDFRFLYNRERHLLSIGYDVDRNVLHKACYDLMASEARLAVFLAIAKGDILLETWFRLGRPCALTNGARALLSWSGTMFEYLMPTLWMRAYPDTLLRESIEAAIVCQRRFGKRSGGLWGISESAHAFRDDMGRYGYRAFGLPSLALGPDAASGVLAPYATFLSLPFAPAAAVENLQTMAAKGWTGHFGLYESIDFRPAAMRAARKPEPVRSWMVHHEGMSLLAMVNLLANESNIQRFHRIPAVKGVERILQERFPLSVHPARVGGREVPSAA